MASTASSSSHSPISILLGRSSRRYVIAAIEFNLPVRKFKSDDRRGRACSGGLRVCAVAESEGANPKGPVADSRIHWENDDEGWLGVDTRSRSRSGGDGSISGKSGSGGSETSSSAEQLKPETERDMLAAQFADLLNDSSDSHYQFLGVAPQADLEEIKSAYRRLSKEYHPDTTSLPIKAASDKFMRLREIYDVLSDEEKRRFYDWTLAQEVASRQAEKMRMKLQDPYIQGVENWESVPDMVDRLGGRNMPLSDQAMSALTIDIAIIFFAIGCIVYVLYFKEPY
ncbi:unnamed protein product [Rhodiola kirilowii]